MRSRQRVRISRLPGNSGAPWGMVVLVGICLTLGFQPAVAHDLAAPSPPPKSAGVTVRVGDGSLSIEAREASWAEVLDALQQQTGIRLHLSIPLAGTVTVSCTDLPAEQALRCLFGREANFLFSYRASDSSSGAAASPSEVWVLGKGSGKVAQTAQVKGKPAPAEAGEALSALLGEAGKEFARNPQATRDAALHAANGDVRRLAIAYLTQRGKPEDLHILTEMVRDQDPQVRQSAVEALGPWLIDDPQVRQAFTRVTETSEDPEVRQLAADALGIGGPLRTGVNADQ